MIQMLPVRTKSTIVKQASDIAKTKFINQSCKNVARKHVDFATKVNNNIIFFILLLVFHVRKKKQFKKFET